MRAWSARPGPSGATAAWLRLIRVAWWGVNRGDSTMTTVYSPRDFTWKGRQLFVTGRRKPVAEVIEDAKYPGIMWRFRLLPDGELSDMVNLSRAKDAAMVHALHAPRSGP